MLRAMLDKEKFETLDDVTKALYKEKDGKYILDVQKTDGLGLEDVSGLKSTVEKLRASERVLQGEVKTAGDALKVAQSSHKEAMTKYDGIDAEAARSALGKIAEIKNWDGETKVKEAVTVAVQEVEQKAKIRLEEVVVQHTTIVDGLQVDLKESQDQLQEAIVTSKIIEAISVEGGNVSVLMPHVKSQVKMVKDGHGKWKPEVQKEDGTPRIGDSAGNDMTVTQLVQEMKTQDTFAGCFSGTNQSGTGKQNSSDSNAHQENNENVKVINSSDDKSMSKNLEKIASGEVKVDMGISGD